MRKPATADAEIHELMRERWSPRAIASDPVPPAHLQSLIEAARWAASSGNEQPWAFVVADRYADPEGHARIASTLVPANAIWAARAPILMVAVARLANSRNEAPNRHAHYDTGQAVSQLSLQATALGLVVHQMAGFSVEKARELLAIPDGHEPMAVIAIGYPGDPAQLSAELQTRESAPRRRRPVNEFVYGGRWGDPLSNSSAG